MILSAYRDKSGSDPLGYNALGVLPGLVSETWLLTKGTKCARPWIIGLRPPGSEHENSR
jgi:hypothetical protein